MTVSGSGDSTGRAPVKACPAPWVLQRILQSLPSSPSAISSYGTVLGPPCANKGRPEVSAGMGRGVGARAGIVPGHAHPALQAPMTFTAPFQAQVWVLKAEVFIHIFGLLGAWDQPWAPSSWHLVGGHPALGWVGAGRAHFVLLFAGLWCGTGTTQQPRGCWRWLRLWKGKKEQLGPPGLLPARKRWHQDVISCSFEAAKSIPHLHAGPRGLSWHTAWALQPPKPAATSWLVSPSLLTSRSPLGLASQARAAPATQGSSQCHSGDLLPMEEVPGPAAGLVFGHAGPLEV